VKQEGGIIDFYNSKLVENPLVTKSIAQSLLQGAQEVFAQLVVGQFDHTEILYLAGYGGLVAGPLSYVVGQVAQRVLAGRSPVARILWVLFVQLPISLSAFIAFRVWQRGQKLGHDCATIHANIHKAVQATLFPTWKKMLLIYIPAIFVIPRYVPPRYHVVVYDLLGFTIGVGLKIMQKKKEQQKAAQG